MTKTQALQSFWSGYGLSAYPKDNVPDSVKLPYLTYEKKLGESAEATIHLYYHTSSEAVPDNKAEEICKALDTGKIVKYDNGAFFITTSNPRWFSTSDQQDAEMKHRIINVTVNDLTIIT